MTIDDYIKLAQERDRFDYRGGNSYCYLFDDVALLYGYNVNKKVMEERKNKIAVAKSLDINVAGIIDYKISDNLYSKGWTLQERARGNILHPPLETFFIYSEDDILDNYYRYKSYLEAYFQRLKMYASSQNHLDKFVKDWILLESMGLVVDPSKPNNFLYDYKNGFIFIDINIGKKRKLSDSYIAYCVIMNLVNRFPKIVVLEDFAKTKSKVITLLPENLKEIILVVKEIFEKLAISFSHNGLDSESIDKSIKHYGFHSLLEMPIINDDDIIKLIFGVLEEVRDENKNSPNDYHNYMW